MLGLLEAHTKPPSESHRSLVLERWDGSVGKFHSGLPDFRPQKTPTTGLARHGSSATGIVLPTAKYGVCLKLVRDRSLWQKTASLLGGNSKLEALKQNLPGADGNITMTSDVVCLRSLNLGCAFGTLTETWNGPA